MKSEERGYKFLIPENLDIPAILRANEEMVEKYEIKEIRIQWFCDLLLKQRVEQRKQMIDDETEYVRLSSVLMQNAYRGYKDVIGFLEYVGVINISKQFLAGEFCRGYKFTDEYSGVNSKAVKVENSKPISSIKRQERYFSRNRHRSLRGYHYLMVGYNSGLLDIDLPAANLWIENYLEEQLALLKPKSKNYKKKFNILHDTAHDFKLQVLKIKEKQYNPFFSGKGHRLYSVITNLKKELRNFLSYDGKKLVEVDLKNCQPFLVLNLLREDFWNHNPESKLLNISKIDEILYSKEVESKGLLYDISILVKSFTNLYETGSNLNLFIKHVIEGTFYEYLAEKLSEKWPKRFEDRIRTKKTLLTVWFDDPLKEDDYNSPVHGFKILFPEIYQLFRLIQRFDYKILPNLLQGIESYLLLDRVAKEVSSKLGLIPMFTIHDSILTLEGHAEPVKRIMIEQIEKFTGHEPKVEIKVSKVESNEIWKAIPNYENLYSVNLKGEVKSLERMVKHRSGSRLVPEKLISCRTDYNGYRTYRLSKDGVESTEFLHRILANTFIPNTFKVEQVNHKNGIKSDNRLDNLEWVTASQNTLHAYENNLINQKKKRVVDSCTGEVYESSRDASLKTNVNYNTLRGYLSGRKENPTCLQYEAA